MPVSIQVHVQADSAQESTEQAEQCKSTVLILTCVPGPFAGHQDHKQGLLVGLGSCQL